MIRSLVAIQAIKGLILCTDSYWNNPANRRNFFIEYALQKGFDPIVSKNWSRVKIRDFIKEVQ